MGIGTAIATDGLSLPWQMGLVGGSQGLAKLGINAATPNTPLSEGVAANTITGGLGPLGGAALELPGNQLIENSILKESSPEAKSLLDSLTNNSKAAAQNISPKPATMVGAAWKSFLMDKLHWKYTCRITVICRTTSSGLFKRTS